MKNNWFDTRLLVFLGCISGVLMAPLPHATSVNRTMKGLVAYDCAADELNVTAISLYRPQECSSPTVGKTTTIVRIQVIQQRTSHRTRVIQCSLMTERSITHCGMHSHASMVANSYAHEIKMFTYPECLRLLETGHHEFDHRTRVWNIKPNTTTRGESIIAGSITGSSCIGAYYSSGGQEWEEVVVRLKYEFRLYEFYAIADVPKNIISLRNGLQCPFSSGHCVDALEGSVTWDVTIKGECPRTEYVNLFNGNVNKTTSANDGPENSLAIYAAKTEQGLFSIRSLKKTEACGYIVYSTDHPLIYIYEVLGMIAPFRNYHADARDLDIFTYFNSKINLLESHMHHQMEQLYDELYTDVCEMEKKVLGTQLILARLYPNDFASELMRSDGYTAVVAGETIYLLQCRPVYVRLNPLPECYQEIPVLRSEEKWFMTPMTRILQKEGTRVECSSFLAPKYRFGDKWYTLDGTIRETPPPDSLSTGLKANWTYSDIPELMNAGIYSLAQVNQMRERSFMIIRCIDPQPTTSRTSWRGKRYIQRPLA